MRHKAAWMTAAMSGLAATVLLAVGDGAEEQKPLAFAYRSFWPEFGAMRQFKDAGVNTVCIFAANTDNSLGKPHSKYPPVWHWFEATGSGLNIRHSVTE